MVNAAAVIKFQKLGTHPNYCSPRPSKVHIISDTSAAMPRRRRTEDFHDDMRPTLDRFADDTSMLGFRYLHSRYQNWFRYLWGMILIFCIGLTGYQVSDRVMYYFVRNPVTTIRSYDTPSSIGFPTIGICNKMQLKASRIAAHDTALVRAMCNAHQDDGQVTTNNDTLDALDNFSHVDMLEIHRNAQQTVDELFLSCDFGKSGSCRELIRPLLTPNGLCFVVSPNFTVTRPGPEMTLSLLLNLESYEIIPGTVADPGVTISLYDQKEALSEQFMEGIHLEAGKAVTIPINEVRKLRRYKQSCGRREVSPFNISEYSRAACVWAHTSQKVETACHCRPVNSPFHRTALAGHVVANSTRRKHRRKIKRCTLREELTCVQQIQKEASGMDMSHVCPEDCEDVSFSSVVFGHRLLPADISQMLPSDWEDTKETQVAQFQRALDVFPTDRIPVIRSVQQLANEVQAFMKLAAEIYDIHSESIRSPCLAGRGGQSLLDHSVMQLRNNEPMWGHITMYVDRSMSREVNSTAHAIGLRIRDDASLDQNADLEKFKYNSSSVSLSLLQLGSMESALSLTESAFGLRLLSTDQRHRTTRMALTFVREMRDCVLRLHDNQEESAEIAAECRKIFTTHYEMFLNAKRVYQFTDSSSVSFKEYEDNSTKVVTALRRVIHTNRVRILDWRDHQINLKIFESLYRDGGRDYEELNEVLRLRKIMLTDLIELRKPLDEDIRRGLAARQAFLEHIGLWKDETPADLEGMLKCLDEFTSKLPLLKKTPFVRSEWLARVQRQVELAQSYSATPQYDQVNLLHIKLYFAHFKQETIVQDRSYNVFLLLAEIGGTIGLYVGATLLSAAETIVFILERKTRKSLLMKANHV